MRLHDWTRVKAGVFHGFHLSWLVHLQEQLNCNLLPLGYFADIEYLSIRRIPPQFLLRTPSDMPSGDLTVALIPEPATRIRRTLRLQPQRRRRFVAVRRDSDLQIVAAVEVVTPADKNSRCRIGKFVDELRGTLEEEIHLLVIDPLPPGPHDPRGLHGILEAKFNRKKYKLPSPQARTFASYLSGDPLTAYLEHPAVGDPLPEVPLFLTPDGCIMVPLGESYQRAWAGTPEVWRQVLEPTVA